jgi:fatty acid/phospholipid biosynthesis enzyme
MTIAIDMMGALAPTEAVKGALQYLSQEDSSTNLALVGDEPSHISTERTSFARVV